MLVAGNRKGLVGVGTGKGADTALAIDKAMRAAKKNMISVHLTKSGSIPHNVEAKDASARVIIYPVPGKGVVAGGSVRNVLVLCGVTDVGAKVLSGSKNRLSIARAAIVALQNLSGASRARR